MGEDVEETGMHSGASGAERDAGEQVERGKVASA